MYQESNRLPTEQEQHLIPVPASSPMILARDDMHAREPHHLDESDDKTDYVLLHQQVQAYVGQPVESPWFSEMWATLQQDGKLLLHSGEDPLIEQSHKGNENIRDNLWSFASIVRDNNSPNCKLEAAIDMQNLFSGFGVRLVRDNEIRIDIH